MENSRFDRFTKRFATDVSRRSLLGGATAASVATVLGMNATAQDATPVASPVADQPEWLLVVNFDGTGLVPATDNLSNLSLSGVVPEAVAFTDRPVRRFQMVPVEYIADTINGAVDDPLNADLVARLPLSRTSEQLVLELASATYDADEGNMSLQARVLGGETQGTPTSAESGQARHFSAGSLFIDNVVLGDGSCEYEVCGDGDCCIGECLPDGTCCHLNECMGHCCGAPCNAQGYCCQIEPDAC